MFIPRGKILYENLATSYVLVDGLVADLCEGGFSGVVEVVLRQSEVYIIASGGNVAAAIEKRNDGNHSVAYTQTTLASVAERSRRERGRVSIYAYSEPTARAIAGRANAQTLYVGLSTEFTDLTKMIRKLAREKDRQWFIEINSESGLAALIHMINNRCRLISSSQDASGEESDVLDLAGNTALGSLLHECSRAGGTFDVYFQRTSGASETAPQAAGIEQTAAPQISAVEPAAAPPNHARAETMAASKRLDESGPLSPELVFGKPSHASEQSAPLDSSSLDKQRAKRVEVYDAGASAAMSRMRIDPDIESGEIDEIREIGEMRNRDAATLPRAFADSSDTRDHEVSIDGGALRASSDDEAMAEVKRLVGEIARTIEEAIQSADHHDAFSMALRAGQLKIAERYPFLDPFGGDFEYLGGEIVFVGQATAEQFIRGLTEALELAVETVTQSSAHAGRLRAFVTEDLQRLLASNRPQYERFGLDQAIGQIIRAQGQHKNP